MQKSIFVLLLLCESIAFATELKVGAIFLEDELDLKNAFVTYITRVNYDLTLKLVPKIRYLLTGESSDLEAITCELMTEGVVAIFGPSSKAPGDIVASICNNFRIPHFLFDFEMERTLPEKQEKSMTINAYPSAQLLSNIYANIVRSLRWTAFTVVFDSKEGLSKLQGVLQLKTLGTTSVKVRDFERGSDYRLLWKYVKMSGERRIVLDCSPDILQDVITAAYALNMTTSSNEFLLTHLDNHLVPTEDFENKKNIHIVRLKTEKHDLMTTRALVLEDAVKLLGSAIKMIPHPSILNPPRMDCRGHKPNWPGGNIIVDFITKTPKMEEVLYYPDIQFGKYNERESFTLQRSVLEPNSSISEFHSLTKFEESKDDVKKMDSISGSSIKKKHLKVSTRIGEPYVMLKDVNATTNLQGNDRYEGYAIDLIGKLATNLDFTYTIEIVEDKQYGVKNPITKEWNGIIGQLINHKADIGICDLTITPERREVVDFTVPFMSLGIAILFYNEPPEPPDLFSFLLPFALEVWVYMATAYLLVSLLLFFMARISKNEWENPHPCNPNPDELENKWNLSNTTWLTMGSIMGQGCDILPRSGTMRLVGGMWWFFALMMLNSYTANLAAFLTSSRIPTTIQGIEDLAGQTKIKFGTVESGSTRTFFKESNDSIYRQIYTKMEQATPSVYTTGNAEGLERVKKSKGKYAFLMESTSLQYLKERNCDVTQAGKQLGQKHYGIALPLGSPYRSPLSVQILKLSERGELFKLKEKWWSAENTCPSYDKQDSNELSIEQLGGVFLVLGCGVFVAYILGLFEFMWNVQQIAVEERVTPFEAFKSEALFAMKFWIKKKPVKCGSEEQISESKSERSLQSSGSQKSLKQ